MASFVSKSFSDGVDTGLQLFGEEWVRTLYVGNNWNHIRIGILMTLSGSASIGAPYGIAIGICSGNTNTYGTSSTTNWIGISNSGGLSYNSNFPAPFYQMANSSFYAGRKIGNAFAAQGSNLPDSIANGFVVADTGSARRGAVYVDITKGSPNFTVGMWGQNNPFTIDATVPILLGGMSVAFGATMSTGGINFHYGNGPVSFLFTEASGSLDTIDIYSNLVSPNALVIYEVSVFKLS